MTTKRGAGGDSSCSDKKTKTAPAAPFLTKTFSEGFWKGSKLDIHVTLRIITLTPTTVPPPPPTRNPTRNPAPFITRLAPSTLGFNKTGIKTFNFEETDVINCRLFVASKCFGADYAGVPHLLEHVLVNDLATYLTGALKGITSEGTTKYEFKLTRAGLEEVIPRIVKTFTDVDHFDKLVESYMPGQVHSVHNEFLEKLFFIQEKFYLGYLLGNKAHVHGGLHGNFCGLCDETDESKVLYKETEQKLKTLFGQVNIPENIYLLLESRDTKLVMDAVESFRASFDQIKSREIVNTIPELEYSLSGKWIKASNAFINSYRELNLAWTIGGTDPIPYEFLATLLSCSLVKGGLVQVLLEKLKTTVYKVESATIKHTSAVRRHFVLRIWLFNNVPEGAMVQVAFVVFWFLQGLKNWIIADPKQFEAQFETFLSLMAVNTEFSDSQTEARDKLNSVATNFVYDSHNRIDPALNIDQIAWQFGFPESSESMHRLGKILDDEFLQTSSMGIIEIDLTKNEFQQLSLEDFYLDQVPLPTEECERNMRLREGLLRLKASKDVLRIDFDAEFIKTRQALGAIQTPVPYLNRFPTLEWQSFMDPCVVIQLTLEWCTDSSPLHPAMPEMLKQFLGYGYSTSYYSAWLHSQSQGPGVLTVYILGLKQPAVKLLVYQVVARLVNLRKMTPSVDSILESTFLQVYKSQVEKMCNVGNFSEDLIRGMMRTNHLFYQDQLVSLDSLATQKSKFYSYFQDVLVNKLHVADLAVRGNVSQQEVDVLYYLVSTSLGNKKCNCSVRQRMQQVEISLEKIVFPAKKPAAVMRKQNCLLESRLQCFQRIYYLNSPILDAKPQRDLVVTNLTNWFLRLCREQRIGYTPSVAFVHDLTAGKNKRLLIFKLPFSTDVMRESDSDFHSMENIRAAVEKYLTPDGFKEVAKKYTKNEGLVDAIATKILLHFECRLTVEIYRHGTTARSCGTQDNAHVIEWYDTNVRSFNIPALVEYRKSVHI